MNTEQQEIIRHAETDPLAALVRRWEQLGERGVTVSICFGQCGILGLMYSVHALGPDGTAFYKPFAAKTLEQAMNIAEWESSELGWIVRHRLAK